ncbi:hypothetical protein BGX27_010396 [Mortierella sp. AM989]|nr:hypothetical protein BGX27_010396 [Mortierella sp. AM989]
MSWTQEQGPTSAWSRTSTGPAEEENTKVPPLLDQRSRFLLSPVPASLAQGIPKTSATAAGLSPTSSSSSSSSTTLTLYPIESVPSHLLCAICTLPYENPVHFLPCCHVFCLECIQLWIGMNLSDDILQGELRRAYPADGDMVLENGVNAFTGYEEMSQTPYYSQSQPLQQQFMFELSRMSDSRSRSGTSTLSNSFYDSFNHLSLAQQQLLQQQQNQQRIAVLLESREMPKCPMCRTGLHINGWDRIEEQIKVPVSVSPRPRPSTNVAVAPSPLEWHERRGLSQGQRPVSGVERRARPDRFTSNGPSRGRTEAIGEEDEDEEIEMEHVGALRDRGNSGANNTLSSYPPSSSSSTHRSRQSNRSDRSQQRNLEQPIMQTDHRMHQYSNRDYNDGDNDDNYDEIQSPTTAVIGRRPSEWMQYQQRQLQAQQERQQANRLRANAAATGHYDQDETPHPYALVEERYSEQQERIRRLYLEQESQEELLRTLSARAASIIEEQEESRRRESNSGSLAFASSTGGDTANNSLHQSNMQPSELNGQRETPETSSERIDGGVTRPQPRHSLLQINTSLSRYSQPSETPSRQVSRESIHSRDIETPQNRDIEQSRQEQSNANLLGSMDNEEERSADDSDNNSIINAIQQGTRAWAQHPSSPVPSPNDDDGDMSISDSVSDSTRSSSGSQSPSLPLSPFNESTLSYRTSSTFSRSVQNNSSIRTSFSQRSTGHSQWHRYSLSLQMPTIEADDNGFGQVESVQTLGDLIADTRGDYAEQPWADHRVEEEGNVSCRKDLNMQEEDSEPTSCARLDAPKAITQPDKLLDEFDEVMSCSSSTHTKNSSEVKHEDAHESSATGLATENEDEPHVDNRTQGSSSGAALSAKFFGSPSLYWKAGSSMLTPMMRELDIHSPIATAEGSMITIADMQIDADILARARSNSIIFSDEDVHSIRERPSPIDSPMPTPSTTRPRRRFPVGFSLDGEEDDQVEDEYDEYIDDSHDAQLALESDEMNRDASEERATHEDGGNTHVPELPQEDINEQTEEVTQENIPEVNMPTVDTAHRSPAASTTSITRLEDPAMTIQDPLSAVTSDSEVLPIAHVNLTEPEQEPIPSQTATPLVRSLRATMSSPPPLPLPLPVSAVDQEAELTPHPSQPNAAPLLVADEPIPVTDEESTRATRDSRPPSIVRNTQYLGTDIPQNESTSLLDHFSSEISMNPQEEDSSAARVREHIQYRTMVRYQPKLPKAHVMSDLISQIRVQCPYKEFGCVEIMEMQNAIQHGREKCQFRMVMCPRPRCGLWMRADQIVEHVMMVEPSSSSSSSNSSSVSSPSSSGPPSNSSVRFTGRTASSMRQRNNVNSKDQQRPLRGQRALNGGSPSSMRQQQHQDAVTSAEGIIVSSEANPLIQPCAGLTWEREQLARATGIIGQLSEENSSLRQMIRQLTMQNTKLLKDKDRWQRYANIGLGLIVFY